MIIQVIDVKMKENKNKKDEIVGYIKTVLSPSFISKRTKYRVEIRAYEPIKSLEHISFEVLGHFADIDHQRKIRRLLGRLGKVIEQFDKEEGKQFYHYLFYVSLPKGVKLSKEDVADELQNHLKINEGCKIQSVNGVRIKLFPWEKDKIGKKIPLTKAALDHMIENVKKKKKKNSTK